MADIFQIQLPNGDIYDFKDSAAQNTLLDLSNHIIFSQTEPVGQKNGDIWGVIEEDNN